MVLNLKHRNGFFSAGDGGQTETAGYRISQLLITKSMPVPSVRSLEVVDEAIDKKIRDTAFYVSLRKCFFKNSYWPADKASR